MTLPIWLIAGLVGVGVGGGGALMLTRGGNDGPATVEAATGLVDSAGGAANAERLAELRVSEALASAPAAVVVCRAAVGANATPLTVALCADLACMAHVEGAETSAGLGCRDRGETLDHLLTGQTDE